MKTFKPELTRRASTVNTYEKIAKEVKEQNLLSKDPLRILDFGAGFGKGREVFEKEWPSAEIVSYDPYPVANVKVVMNNLPKGKFDLIFCIYVLNVCLPVSRKNVIKTVDDLLEKDGIAIYRVRSFKGDIENTKTGIKGEEVNSLMIPVEQGVYTYQKGFDFDELSSEISWELNVTPQRLKMSNQTPPTVWYKK